jgi:hypothetical protein
VVARRISGGSRGRLPQKLKPRARVQQAERQTKLYLEETLVKIEAVEAWPPVEDTEAERKKFAD